MLSEQLKQEIIEKAKSAMKRSLSPYSNFKVGCSILTQEGSVFCGTNVERSYYELTTHAEDSAISAMIFGGHKMISAVVVATSNGIPPCKNCRKLLASHTTQNFPVFLLNTSLNSVKETTIFDLAPWHFKLAQMELFDGKTN